MAKGGVPQPLPQGNVNKTQVCCPPNKVGNGC